MVDRAESGLQRRVAGYHDLRLDGLTDLVMRAKGASVLDLGCNRGLISFEMFNNGAKIIHGVEIDPDCVLFCNTLFADFRSVQSKFVEMDLAEGAGAFKRAFGEMQYDIVLCIATYHKIRRLMSLEDLDQLMAFYGKRTKQFFAWRGPSNDRDAAAEEMVELDNSLGRAGLHRIHTSEISKQLGLAAIWGRP
jgi:SAM-dependent methyltransferase